MELSKEKLIELLSGKERLFAEVYEAVAEQYLLLAMKARHLYKNEQYSKWFKEQDRVLKALCKQRDAISTAYNAIHDAGYNSAYSNHSKADLDVAMKVMNSFYHGFDNGKQILKTWWGMGRPSSSGERHLHSNQSKQDYVQGDLFELLHSCNPSCTPIPLDERMDYSHQDLAISFSCSDTIISSLNEFFNIDYLDILDETVESFSKDNDEFNNLTSLLLERRRMPADSKNTDSTREPIIAAVNLLFTKISYIGVQHFLSVYVELVAQVTHGWLMETQRHFKFRHPVNYKWKYNVVDLRKEGTDYLSSLTQDNIYGQISISRASIIQLIRRNGAAGFDDVALEISRELGQLYKNLLAQDAHIENLILDEKETIVFDNKNSIISDRAVAYLSHLAEWYDKNNVLFYSDAAKRKDKANVAAWLCGLKLYDMKIGIPNRDGIKLKEAYKIIKLDKDLHGIKNSSIPSLQRYQSKIKTLINNGVDADTGIDVTVLINKQKELNENTPFNGAIYATRPLWEQ